MFNIVIHQGNANQNHSKILLYTYSNVWHQSQITSTGKDVGKISPHTLLVGM